MSKLVELITEFEAFQKEFKEKAQKAFNEAVQQFFQDNPEVRMIHWVQYSPYFNDGDECVFSVHEVRCTNGTPDDMDYMGVDMELSQEAEQEGKWVYPEWRGPERDIKGFDELASFINSQEDMMHEMFGNHAQVIITRDGISVEEYSHD
jgi:hypothetical protein